MEQQKKDRDYNILTKLEELTDDDIGWVNDQLERDVKDKSARVVAQRAVRRLQGHCPTSRRAHLECTRRIHNCIWCGTEVTKGDRYCRHCGSRIKWEG